MVGGNRRKKKAVQFVFMNLFLGEMHLLHSWMCTSKSPQSVGYLQSRTVDDDDFIAGHNPRSLLPPKT